MLHLCATYGRIRQHERDAGARAWIFEPSREWSLTPEHLGPVASQVVYADAKGALSPGTGLSGLWKSQCCTG